MTSLVLMLVVAVLALGYAWFDERQRRIDIERSAVAAEAALKESLSEAVDKVLGFEKERERLTNEARCAEHCVEVLERELELATAVALAAQSVVSSADAPLGYLREAVEEWDEHLHPVSATAYPFPWPAEDDHPAS